MKYKLDKWASQRIDCVTSHRKRFQERTPTYESVNSLRVLTDTESLTRLKGDVSSDDYRRGQSVGEGACSVK
jgi:hypothetical protein